MPEQVQENPSWTVHFIVVRLPAFPHRRQEPLRRQVSVAEKNVDKFNPTLYNVSNGLK
jgi:5,10-methylene-tetrahydrofolate dehydrogenase/methenyl tetrahydrofolate cyclohydrolase